MDKRIVVAVDDEEGDLAVIEAILSDDYHVVLCRSGTEALEKIEKYQEAIVLCDQRMPGLTGDEVLMRIRILYPETIRILVTAYSDPDALIRALNEGRIFGYLQKPFDAHTLRKIVERAASQQLINIENKRLKEENARLQSMLDKIIAERVSTLEAENRELRALARTDELTELANARYLRERLSAEYMRVLKTSQPLSLILADIDDFKRINDKYGHAVGDEVLKAVANAIRGTVRGADLAARVGGEEFVVMAPGTNEIGAGKLAERIRLAVESLRIKVRDVEITVTISLGYASCELPEMVSIEEALRRADESMYQAKKEGKNRCRSWSDVKRYLAKKPQSIFVARQRNEAT